MRRWIWLIIILFVLLGCATVGWVLGDYVFPWQKELFSPIVEKVVSKPLQKYSLSELNSYPFQPSNIKIVNKLWDQDGLSGWLFTYLSAGKTISGQMVVNNQIFNAPPTQPVPTIVLVRGFVPLEIYKPGVGTQNAAKVFAKAGYITFAPDFLGYGQSDPELPDTWEGRFIKPVNLAELILSLEAKPVTFSPVAVSASASAKPSGDPKTVSLTITPKKLGIWAHSNGGQVALSYLAGTLAKYPTTLWAPVTAPFPYSIMFFSDEEEDEGKAMRQYVADFEKLYNVFDFSISKHLNRLHAPLQIHHGSNDEAALLSWSQEFMDKVEAENIRREDINAQAATNSALVKQDPISAQFFIYAGADHNLQPGENWQKAIERDLAWFEKAFGSN